MNQQDEPGYCDYSSFGSGPDGTDSDETEVECRQNFLTLVERLTRYERALDVTSRLRADGINLQDGDNTFIFNARIDNGVIRADENSDDAELMKVNAAYTVRN